MCKLPSKLSSINSTITERYTYDNNGNRLSQEINTTIGVYNQEDQLESYGTTEYTYDKDGYLQTKTTPTGTTTYEYGIFGELKSVTLEDTTLIEYKHNANHQRVAKYINKELKEKYLWLNLTTLLATYDKENNLINRYSYTNDRVPTTMEYNNQTYHLLYNHQGSLRAVVDQEGTIIKELHYDSFGIITLDRNPDFKIHLGFAGGLYDEDTKLTRFGYRDYDAHTGKWTAKDPIGFSGGDTNLYGYVLQDPVGFVDPLGLSGFDNRNGGHGHNRNGGPYSVPFGPICGSGPSARWVPDIFPDSCQKHDDCYGTCGKTKLECDLDLVDPYGWALRHPFSNQSQEAYDNAQKHCKNMCTE